MNNIEKAKETLKQVIKEQEQKYNIKLNISILSVVEYYKSDTFKKKLKLSKPNEKFLTLIVPIIDKAIYYNENKEILLFIKILNKKKLFSLKLPDLILTTLHEIRHYHQSNLSNEYTEFENFIFLMELIVRHNNKTDYNTNYDKYYSEIDANYYCITEAKKYLDLNNPFHKNFFEYYNSRYTYQLKTYNPEPFFEKFNTALKSPNYFKIAIYKHPFLTIFYNDNATFKSPKEILNSLKKTNIDPNIISTILCSTSFLQTLNTNDLSQEEKEFFTSLLLNKHKDLKEKLTITNEYFEEQYSNRQDNQTLIQKLELLKYKTIDFLSTDMITNLTLPKQEIELNELSNTIDKINNKTR